MTSTNAPTQVEPVPAEVDHTTRDSLPVETKSSGSPPLAERTTMTSKTAVVGNFTDDPELRFSNAGKPWLRGRIRVKPYVPGAAEQPEPVFYDVVAFGSLAENVAESCLKGSRVVVTGSSRMTHGPDVTVWSGPVGS